MLRTQALALSAAICVFALATSASAGKPETGFLNRTLTTGAKAAPIVLATPVIPAAADRSSGRTTANT